MSSSNKFNKILLADKGNSYSNLNLENISYYDCKRAKKYTCPFGMKSIEDYYDLHIQCDTLL